jgi:predicted neutral ceramidase superfamily lipid hydrolase
MGKITTRELRTTGLFASAGFLVAVTLVAVWYFVNSQSFDPKIVLTLQDFTVLVWPSSLMMMGAQHSGWIISTLGILLSATVNAFLYGLVGFGFAAVCRKLRGAHAPK